MRDDACIRELARQIAGGVPLDPIILFEDQVLDRWELYLACREAGREPTFETYTGKDPIGFLIARQIQRGLFNRRGACSARGFVTFQSGATNITRVCQLAEPPSCSM